MSAPPKRTLRVLQYPNFPKNPYQRLLAEALEQEGVSTEFTTSLRDLVRGVWAGDIDVFHIHWTHFLILPGLVRSLARILAFALILRVARLRGIGIVWTLHNASAHDARKPVLDRWATLIAARLADRIVVHGPEGARVATEDFLAKQGKVVIVPHGNYRAHVAPLKPRQGKGAVRFLAWGQIRSYKGFEDLVLALDGLEGRAELVVAGMPAEKATASSLRQLAAERRDVRFVPGHLGPKALARWLQWSDFVVMPYRKTLTSGVLLMSLSSGRPVILPRLGDLPAYVSPASALVYDPAHPDGLQSALRAAADLSADVRVGMAQAAAREAERFSWTTSAQDTARIYRATCRKEDVWSTEAIKFT